MSKNTTQRERSLLSAKRRLSKVKTWRSRAVRRLVEENLRALRPLRGDWAGAGAGTGVTAILAAILLFAAGCETPEQTHAHWQQRQSEQRPIRLAEVDGVKVWKVRDATPGGRAYVYFVTSRAGRIIGTDDDGVGRGAVEVDQ